MPQLACPDCKKAGKKVDTATLKALLAVSLRSIDNDAHYYFCATQDCEIVYFTDANKQLYTTSDVREVVYQKAPDAPETPICYCFGYTVADVLTDIREEAKTIVPDIEAGVAEGQCACDWRNPQGTCCLGNVRKLIKISEISQGIS